ncbi:MAG: DUF2892 domain-containing protein [Verrucomicrobiaceae bacterium]|nr:MAG: DUF2892 domain-containing protein [Verrucomicrobiaceae bacterium]
MTTIKPKELNEKISVGEVSESQIVDVRSPGEHREIHLAGSSFLPLDSLTSGEVVSLTSGRQIFLLCGSGVRAAKAREKLKNEGVGDAVVIEGGIMAWEKAGLPVIRGESGISLERQVRIAAGTLVVVGTLLGYFVNSYGHLLAGMVGAGLVFAGVSNTCGLGMLIAKMPWNRSCR